MQRLFLDTNIILDLLGERDPFYESTARLVSLADRQKIALVVSPISFATVSYFLSKYETAGIAKEKLRKFKILCEVCILNEAIVEKSLNSTFTDFEDALQYYSALEASCDIIVTRNGKDFKKSAIPVMSTDEYLKKYTLIPT